MKSIHNPFCLQWRFAPILPPFFRITLMSRVKNVYALRTLDAGVNLNGKIR